VRPADTHARQQPSASVHACMDANSKCLSAADARVSTDLRPQPTHLPRQQPFSVLCLQRLVVHV
jgi:hypothetical protein